jgi:hypothetical protein
MGRDFGISGTRFADPPEVPGTVFAVPPDGAAGIWGAFYLS